MGAAASGLKDGGGLLGEDIILRMSALPGRILLVEGLALLNHTDVRD